MVPRPLAIWFCCSRLHGGTYHSSLRSVSRWIGAFPPIKPFLFDPAPFVGPGCPSRTRDADVTMFVGGIPRGHRSASLRSGSRPPRASKKARRTRGRKVMATTMAHQGLMASLALDLAIQGVGWLVSSTLKTEKLFDLLGTGSFLALSVQGTQFAAAKKNPKAKLLAGMVGTWAVRLGTFLVARVFRTGGDSRFDDAKKNPLKFLVYWSMQGVWVFVTALPLLLVQTQGVKSGWTFTDALGFILWAMGFLIESTADYQKLRFRQAPSGKDKFIRTGLWKHSRHPNYFGEMVLWYGIWMSSLSSLPSNGLGAIALASPLFVTFLLCKVSGVPLLEEAADAKWGNLREYQEYKKNTRLLLPIPK